MPTATRTFRIFVSSTFEDLIKERNALHREVFPRLSKLCKSHGARFQAVDLRWGIRDEALLGQKMMDICLVEIERCQQTGIKPNFMVLLGDRYGRPLLPARIQAREFETIFSKIDNRVDRALVDTWYQRDDNAVPSEYLLKGRTGEFVDVNRWRRIDESLQRALRQSARAAGLSSDALLRYEASATHQEIVKGLGTTPEDRKHIFAYFRMTSAANEPSELWELKNFLRQQLGANILEHNAGDIRKLCVDVNTTLEKIILNEVSRFEARPALDLEIEAHDNFASDHAKHFVGRKRVFDALDEYLKSADPRPLVIYGASGSGKSAIMAKALAITAGAPNVSVGRFIGASPESSNGVTLLRSLCEQIGSCFDQPGNALAEYSELAATFSERIRLSKPERPVLLFIDALDHLGADDPAAAMNWVPRELPPHCKIIVSTTEVPFAFQEARQIRVEPLSVGEAEQVLGLWLKEAGRTLQPVQRENVLNSFRHCPLPLYLKLAFEEVRRWHSFDPLEQCALGQELSGIVDQLFTRLSEDSNHGWILVSRALGYLTSARHGLTDDELLEVLSKDNEVWKDFSGRAKFEPPEHRLPVILWSRLHLELEPYLTERLVPGGSVISFYHRQLSEHASAKLLLGEKKLRTHMQLAEYFESRWQEHLVRPFVELVYQHIHGMDAAGLERVLTDLEFVEGKCSHQMTDDLLAEYHDAILQLVANAKANVVSFSRFVQDNAQLLRMYPGQCLQLAIMQPCNSVVGMQARQLSDRLSRACLEVDESTSTRLVHSIRFTEHESSVTAVAFDNEHGQLVSTDGREVIRWDLASSAVVARFNLPSENNVSGTAVVGHGRMQVSLAPDASFIAMGAVIIIDARTGRELWRIPIEGEPTAPPAVSDDCAHLAVSTYLKEGWGRNPHDHAVRVFSHPQHRLVAHLPHFGIVTFCIFSPDKKQLVTLQKWPGYDQSGAAAAEGKAMLRVWDLVTHRTLHSVDGTFDSASYSPDGSLLMAVTGHNLYGWSTSDWSVIFYKWDTSETAHRLRVVDNSHVITSGVNSVTLRNILTSETEGRFVFTDERRWIYTLAFSPRNLTFALGCGDGRVELWTLESLRDCLPTDVSEIDSSKSPVQTDVRDFATQGRGITFSPDGHQLVVCRNNHIVSILNAKTGSTIVSRLMINNHSHQVDTLQRGYFTTNGDSLILLVTSSRAGWISPSGAHSGDVSHFGSLRRLSASDLRDHDAFECKSQEFLYTLRFSSDGTRVFVFRSDRSVLQLRADNLLLIDDQKTGANAADWTLSPDGSEIAWGNRDDFQIWSFAVNRFVLTAKGYLYRKPVFAPDGRLIAVSCFLKHHDILKLISVRKGYEIAYVRQNARGGWNAWEGPDQWAFSPDGRKILLIGSKSLAVFELRNGRSCTFDQGGFTSPVTIDKELYQFSPDGQFVFGVQTDCVRIWDCESGALVTGLPLTSIECSTIHGSGSRLALTQAGVVRLFRFRNLPLGLPIVTGTRVYEFDAHSWSSLLSTRCPMCGSRFSVPASIENFIVDVQNSIGIDPDDSSIMSLPEESWAAGNLISSCTHCGGVVRFNPFLADGTKLATRT